MAGVLCRFRAKNGPSAVEISSQVFTFATGGTYYLGVSYWQNSIYDINTGANAVSSSANTATGTYTLAQSAYDPLTVNTNGDAVDGEGDLVTLREAILASASGDTIVFNPGIAGQTIDLVQGTLSLDNPVEIVGLGADQLTIDGNLIDRVFDIVSAGDFVISDLTITGGSTASAGGAIHSAAANHDLTVLRSAIVGNSANSGGGIFSAFGNLEIDSSLIEGNTAATGGGGAQFFDGTFALTNTTVSNNAAPFAGGILHTADGTASQLSVDHVTIANNDREGIINEDQGGGALLEISHTILGLRQDPNFANIATAGPNSTVTSFGFNLADDAPAAFNAPGDIVNTDPMLGALSDNGGPTLTHALLPGSAAIDNGQQFLGGFSDQRGAPFDRVFNTVIDIGAFEFQPILVKSPSDEFEDTDGLMSLREAVAFSSTIPGQQTIEFDSALTGQIRVNDYPITIYEEVEITGRGSGLEISGFDQSRIFDLRLPAQQVVVLNDLVLKEGRSALGGAIRLVGHDNMLVVNNSTIRNNVGGDAQSGITSGGAAIYMDGGSVVINDSMFTNNQAHSGGAIYMSSGTLLIENSSLASNTATDSGGAIRQSFGALSVLDSSVAANSADQGGGIQSSGTLSVAGSTISSNTAAADGGGVHLNGGEATFVATSVFGNSASRGAGINSVGTLSVDTSTINNNTAAMFGGGIRVFGADATVASSTLFNNSSGNMGGGLMLEGGVFGVAQTTMSSNSASVAGGGLFFGGSTALPGVLALTQSTLASNSATFGANLLTIETADGIVETTLSISGTILASPINGTNLFRQGDTAINSGGYNIADDNATLLTDPNDRINTNAMLDALDNNGGPTLTHKPLVGSPAINGGDPAYVGSLDQRGEARIRGGIVDVGAVEVNPPVVADFETLSDPSSLLRTYVLRENEVVFFTFELAHDVLAGNGDTLTIDTIGSTLTPDNDTEIGLFDENGNLIDSNDDDPALGLLSRLTFGAGGASGNLTSGIYFVALAGYDALFGPGFDATSTSGETGVAQLNIRLNDGLIGCDLNGDLACNGADIDLLVAEIAAGTNNSGFDLTGDGSVNVLDRDEWLSLAGAMNLPSGNSYLLGDANLDGAVDGQDFVSWNDSKFSAGNGWTGGDFNADGTTDGQDFLLWNDNKFTSADLGPRSHHPGDADTEREEESKRFDLVSMIFAQGTRSQTLSGEAMF